VAAGFYQQVQTTRTNKKPDGEQSQTAQSMQTAMKIMPIFFGFISWTLTAGLGIYFATSNLFRVGQQALILRLDDRGDDDKKKPALPADTPPEDGEPEKMGPSENASKKKNRRRRK
jgi:membrane protein insertase Oxa1/YidC/SpoIIIJ